MDGKLTGPHYQKRPRPVVNSSAVDARRDAVESANVSRQNLSALRFATAVACVLSANIAFHHSMQLCELFLLSLKIQNILKHCISLKNWEVWNYTRMSQFKNMHNFDNFKYVDSFTMI